MWGSKPSTPTSDCVSTYPCYGVARHHRRCSTVWIVLFCLTVITACWVSFVVAATNKEDKTKAVIDSQVDIDHLDENDLADWHLHGVPEVDLTSY